jgi:serine/threonine protein kinase
MRRQKLSYNFWELCNTYIRKASSIAMSSRKNVLLDANGDAKLGDFGLAALVSTPRRLRQSCGTTEYMSPEVLDVPQEGYDTTVDIWSAGVLM